MASIVQPLFQKLSFFVKNPTSPLAPTKHHHPKTAAAAATRRSTILHYILITAIPSSLILIPKPVSALEMFRFTIPDQTLEEAENGIKIHSRDLLKLKDLIMEESWRQAQKGLRKNSSYLKQDIYTIIQAKPSKERQRLRKMYSDLFNAVSKLDYALRDKDKIPVWEFYQNVVLSLHLILSEL